jgi:hypothetical protein
VKRHIAIGVLLPHHRQDIIGSGRQSFGVIAKVLELILLSQSKKGAAAIANRLRTLQVSHKPRRVSTAHHPISA